nr:hypothetical protein [Candidatus Gracilibacteria bacterium]
MISLNEKQTNKSNLLYLGYFFLLFSVVLTASLFFYNLNLEKNIVANTDKINQINESITKLQDDKNIQVYNLLQQNKNVLADLTKKSRIKDFIYHVRSLEGIYGIVFKGFNYNNGNLSLQASAPFNSTTLASNRVSMFIKSYREDPKSMFDLGFINNFNGFDSMTFGVNLTLK